MFRNREDAAHRLVQRLQGRKLHAPLVLAIPRGGVVTGAVLRPGTGCRPGRGAVAELRAPNQPELAVGAVSENGQVYLNPFTTEMPGLTEEYLAKERRYQLAEIARRQKLFRSVRPPASLTDRSVIVTDDGIATGATLLAALQTVKGQCPHETIVAVPVSSPDRLREVRQICDEMVCLLQPEDFGAVGQFYQDFSPVEDEQVVDLLREFAPVAQSL